MELNPGRPSKSVSLADVACYYITVCFLGAAAGGSARKWDLICGRSAHSVPSPAM